MRKLTKNDIKGMQFEIFLEKLFMYYHNKNQEKFQNIKRNVVYQKAQYVKRQVDLQYDYLKGGRIHRALIEAKYSSGPSITHNFWGETLTRNTARGKISISNLLSQIKEREYFISSGNPYYHSILVTNKDFDDWIVSNARRYGVGLIDGPYLSKHSKPLRGRMSLDNYIRSINIYAYDLEGSSARI